MRAMVKVPISQLAQGQTLAADVLDRSGRTLGHQGQELNKKLIRVLKTWGITEVPIKHHYATDDTSQSKTLSGVETLKLSEKDQLDLDRRFKHINCRHPAVIALKRCIATRIAGKGY